MLGAGIVLLARSATAQTASEHPAVEKLDHTIIVGVAGAAELELGDGTLHPGANVMVEWDARLPHALTSF
jgi:hypothetical protein